MGLGSFSSAPSKIHQNAGNRQWQGCGTTGLQMWIWRFNLLLRSWLLLSGENELCPWAPGPQGWIGASTGGSITGHGCCLGACGTRLFPGPFVPLWQAPSASDLLGCCVFVFLPWVREQTTTVVPLFKDVAMHASLVGVCCVSARQPAHASI